MTARLNGRVALVTGVSRPEGIAPAVADRLRDRGATVFTTGWPAADEATGPPLPVDLACDLSDPDQPARLIDTVIDAHGALDIVVAVHARSASLPLAESSADELDLCWAANVRSVVLLARHFATRHDGGTPGGRMIWFTSGQHLGPMPGEIPYAVSKGALAAMTPTLAVPLAEAGIIANCINPGPVDTGWADGDVHTAIASRFSAGRWGTPDDVANLIEFLVSDAGAWIQGQVIDSEGGFRRG